MTDLPLPGRLKPATPGDKVADLSDITDGGQVDQVGLSGSLTRSTVLRNRTLTVDTISELRTALSSGVVADVYVVRGYTSAGDAGAGRFRGVASTGLTDDGGVTIIGGSLAAVRLDSESATDVPAEWFGVPVTSEVLTAALRYANQLPDDAFDVAPDWAPGMRLYVTGRRLRYVTIAGMTDPLDTLHLWYRIAGIKGRSQGAAVIDHGSYLRFKDNCGPAIVFHTGTDIANYTDQADPAYNGYHYITAYAVFRGLKIGRVGSLAPTAADVGVLVDGLWWFAGYDLEGCWITGHYHGIEFSSQYLGNFGSAAPYAGYCNIPECTIQGNLHWGIYAPGLVFEISNLRGRVIQNTDGGINAGIGGGSVVGGDCEGAAAYGVSLVARGTRVGSYYGESIHASFVGVSLSDSDFVQVDPQYLTTPLGYGVSLVNSHDCDVADRSPVMVRGCVDVTTPVAWHVPGSASEGMFSIATDYTREDQRLRRFDRLPGINTTVWTDATFLDSLRLDGAYVAGKYLGDAAAATVLTMAHVNTTGAVLVAFALQRLGATDSATLKVESYAGSAWTTHGEKTFETKGLAQFVCMFHPAAGCTQIRLTLTPYVEGTPGGATVSGIVLANIPAATTGVECFRIGPLFDETLDDWRLAQRQILRYAPSVLWVPPREVGISHTLSGANLATLIDLSGNGNTGTVTNGLPLATIGGLPAAVLTTADTVSIADSAAFAGGQKFTRMLVFRDRSGPDGESGWRVTGADTTAMGFDLYNAGAAYSANVYGPGGSYRMFDAYGTVLGLVTFVFDGTLAATDRLRAYPYNGVVGGSVGDTLAAWTANTIGAANLDLALRADFPDVAPTGLELQNLIATAARICGLTV